MGSIATDFVSPTQTTCLTEENQSVLQLKRKKKEERKHQPGKMCVRYTLLIANSLLALLGLLLLAGGVWRIVDDQSLRDVANELRDTAEWDNVAKEVTGLDDAVKEAAGHKYFNYALLGMGGITLLVALFGFCGAKKENQCLLSLYTICVFIILLLQIAAIVFINVDDANINFIKDSISSEVEKVDIDIEKLKPGSKFVQNLFFESRPASPASSSSSPSPSAVEQEGRRGCKDMSMPSKLKLRVSTVFMKIYFYNTES